MAVTVVLNVPVVAVLLAVKLSVELPLPGAAIDVGLKLAVTPLGSPEIESATDELNPFETEVEIVLAPELPCVTVKLVGEALRAKSGLDAGIENDIQDRMQLDSVRSNAGLPVQKIKHAHARDLHGNVRRLEAGGGGEPGIEFISSVGNARQKRAARRQRMWATEFPRSWSGHWRPEAPDDSPNRFPVCTA